MSKYANKHVFEELRVSSIRWRKKKVSKIKIWFTNASKTFKKTKKETNRKHEKWKKNVFQFSSQKFWGAVCSSKYVNKHVFEERRATFNTKTSKVCEKYFKKWNKKFSNFSNFFLHFVSHILGFVSDFFCVFSNLLCFSCIFCNFHYKIGSSVIFLIKLGLT